MAENLPPEPWWHGAILYQIYVRSWQDTNDDGYGDLRGVITRLGYLRWLGVDAIWLSPTMPSPDADWGYDVSDYAGVHPELGGLDDLDELIEAADDAGLRVLLDLVPNHTSSAHPWFVDAASARDSAHRDYYVWADPAPGGGPPSNWLDATGRSAWQWDEATGQYYLHNYLPEQPDLNWWDPAVHKEFAQILEFWFERGVAGFRIDVAHGLYKDSLLRDDPAAHRDGPLYGRFGFSQVYSANRPETHAVYRDWRQIAERYCPPKLLLGETWTGDLGNLARFYGDNDELQLAFNFPFVFAEFTASALAGVVEQMLAHLPAGGCPVWTASNHDVGRFATRWCAGDARKIRLALLVLATLPGATVLYYGDEIGMTDVNVPVDARRDRMTAAAASSSATRDRARTPMRWDAGDNAGFTSAQVRPWLPLGAGTPGGSGESSPRASTAGGSGGSSPRASTAGGSGGSPPRADTAGCDVAGQMRDPESTLSFCRRLIALRRAEFGGRIGRYEPLPGTQRSWSYRVGEIVVLANFSDQPLAATPPVGEFLLASYGPEPRAGHIEPWQGVIYRTS